MKYLKIVLFRSGRICQRLFRVFDRKIANKFILFIICILFVTISALTGITYAIIRENSVAAAVQTGSNNLQLVNKNFENYFMEMGKYTLPGSRYDNLMAALQNESDDYSSRVYLINYVSSLLYSRDDIDSVRLYILNEKESYTIDRSNYSGVQILYGSDATGMEWFKRARASFETCSEPLYQSGEDLSGTRSFAAFYRIFVPIGRQAPIAAIEIICNTISAQKIWNDAMPFEGGHLFLSDNSGFLYYADNGTSNLFSRLSASPEYVKMVKSPGSGHFDWSFGGRRYLVLSNVSENINMRLARIIPYDSIYASARAAANWCIIFGFAAMLLSSIATLLVSRAVTKPLENLSEKIVHFGEGNLNVPRLNVRGTDEIARLGRQFNRMVFRINSLINERYRNELIQKNAVLKALETEINPHFLYNTLQAISTKALKSGAFEVSDMISALAMSFRYCISGADVVKISDEISHIDNYLQLQKARFGERLHVEYDIDNSLKSVEIPKLSIQTLVENSIKHGLDKMIDGITILIGVRRDGGKAIVSVTDDGPGIEPEKLSEIKESFGRDVFSNVPGGGKTELGLKNLNSRLVLIFGSDSALHINNDGKTEIYFSVPLNDAAKGDETDD